MIDKESRVPEVERFARAEWYAIDGHAAGLGEDIGVDGLIPLQQPHRATAVVTPAPEGAAKGNNPS